jgi:carboxypeptidase family protein
MKTKFAVSFFLLLAAAWSQSFQASITGAVKDTSGAVVPAAELTATNIATGLSFSTTSNETGIYRFANLPPAQYRIACTVAGFKRFEEGPVTLQVNQVLEINPQLQPGEMTERVTVTAAPAALETASATVGQIVTTRNIENLPLNVRDALALVGLTPGVTFGGNFGNGGGTDVGRGFYKSDFNVGGGRSGYQEVLIDGAPDTTGDRGLSVVEPPVDSVQEFKVQANSYDAQFGRTSGGIVNVITKGGTNELHGVAYDFERHSVLDANNFFNNRAGIKLPSFQRHQFGGNVGGPILANKLFFFGDYEGLRQGYPQTKVSTVPTALQRAGDFSQTVTSNRQLIQIYDPLSNVTQPNGTIQRTAFTGNRIPTSRINPVAAATLALYPLPNTTGTNITNQNNYTYSADSVTNSDKYDLRADANFTDNTRMFARFSRQQDTRLQPGVMPQPIGGGRAVTDYFTQAVADVTHVFSPTLIADAQFSFSRALGIQYGLSRGFNNSSLGFPSAYANLIADQFPIFNINDITGTSNGSDAIVSAQPRNIFSTLGSVSY